MWGVTPHPGSRYREDRDRGSRLVYGIHVYGNLRRCNPEILKSEEKLRKIVENAAKIGNMTLISITSHKFGHDSGVSVIAIVAESHISIHTWPEYEYATVDVYTCGANSRPIQSFLYIARALEARNVEVYVNDRSLYIGDIVENYDFENIVEVRSSKLMRE